MLLPLRGRRPCRTHRNRCGRTEGPSSADPRKPCAVRGDVRRRDLGGRQAPGTSRDSGAFDGLPDDLAAVRTVGTRRRDPGLIGSETAECRMVHERRLVARWAPRQRARGHLSRRDPGGGCSRQQAIDAGFHAPSTGGGRDPAVCLLAGAAFAMAQVRNGPWRLKVRSATGDQHSGPGDELRRPTCGLCRAHAHHRGRRATCRRTRLHQPRSATGTNTPRPWRTPRWPLPHRRRSAPWRRRPGCGRHRRPATRRTARAPRAGAARCRRSQRPTAAGSPTDTHTPNRSATTARDCMNPSTANLAPQ